MKHLSILILFILFFSSCGENQNETTKDEAIFLEELTKKEKEFEPIIASLKNKKPISIKELDIWAPNNIAEMNRSLYTPNSSPETFVFTAKADYKKGGKSISLSLLDGAGGKGSLVISPFLTLESIYNENSNNDGYQKLILKNGKTFFQKYTKSNDVYVLQFVINNRFVIKIESQSLSEEELWMAIDEFQFENLPN